MDENIFDFDSQYQELLFEDNDNQGDLKTLKTNARENEDEYTNLNLFSIFFNCTGDSKANFNDSIFEKDLEILLNHQNFEIPNEFELFDIQFDENFENFDILIQMARADIQKLHLSSLDSFHKTFYNLRENVTKLLLILRCNYQLLTDNQLKLIRFALGTFDSMANFSLMYMSFCNDGNTSTSSNYHLLHGMLEWKWIWITMCYKLDYFKGQIGGDDAESFIEIKLLIYDLITLSISKFQKCNNANLIFTTPFICSCVREMWLLLYSFIQKLQDNQINFWDIVSNVIEELSKGKSLYENFASKKALFRSSNFMTCRNFDQFSLWIISGLTKLIGSEYPQIMNDRQSYELYENLIKNFLKTDQTEENMRVLLLMISEVLLNVWQPKADILMLLWENFQKKINSPFLIAGQNPNFLAVSANTAASFLEQIRNQQNTAVSKLNPNLTSYSIFVYALGKMVQRFSDDGQKVHIQRILGRIYTKFPAPKLKQLNEMGIHNILKLFITLALSTNLNDIDSKLCDTLLQIPLDKPNHQQLIMKGHISMLILYCENSLNISQYLTKLMTQINILMQQSSSSSTNILKVLSESLSLIVLRNMNENADVFENGEDLLIDSWIIKFLENSTTAEQDRLYETINKIIIKVQSVQHSSLVSNQTSLITQKLFNFLLPYARQNFGKVESIWMPEMIANLCLLSLEPNIILNDIPKFETLFRTFVEINSTNFEQSIKFITIILRSCHDVDKLDMQLIIQNWIRFSVLLSGSNYELKELTKNLIHLPEFTTLCNTSLTKPEEFLNSKEPLCTFISDIGKKYADSNNQEKFQLVEKVHTYFSTFEKWSLPILQQNSTQKSTASQSQTNSVDEHIMRIYTFIAITFLHCAELIFIRTKSSCFFNVAISHFILPSTVMMGQSPVRSMILSIHKVWPLLIEGTSRLNYKNDQHINKVLSDIIIKWAPFLKLSSNSKFVAKPFISITNFKNLDLIEFFWMKLSKNFLALQPGRKVNSHCYMILNVIEEVMHVVECEEKRMIAIWRSIMQQIIEMAMLFEEIEPAQKTCMNLIERYIKNKNFDTSTTMNEHLMKNLKNITNSTSLSYHSALYFKFLTKLSKHRVTIVNSLLSHLITQIEKVEQLRGSGRDVKLRNLYDQLQSQCR
ncbi:hypothetical protein PVAND_009730 [Polypedilum vanderplanki]|uniref:Protein MMS22-like n=1 Tax=Polypedilum vanderplanki TaxID=319348 RepID=A0A9J6CE48_POLVA|nr:hypothetical protein PVAND_009730 [Polypedilum vanderplanki]